jgi:catechol 2,3-dioxygenase-like lactoylglutathione lyase family enzyme
MTAPHYAVDHVGLTVPDVEQATAFFRDALGATVRVDIVTEPVAGPELETALALPAGAVVRRVRMLDVGGGAGLDRPASRTSACSTSRCSSPTSTRP